MNRSTVIAFVFLLILALGAVIVAREFRHQQKSPFFQRRLVQSQLRTLAEALAAYRTEQTAWPETMFQLARHGHLSLAAVARWQYRRPDSDTPDTVVVWPNLILPAIRAGEQLDHGARAERDLPAVAFVLTADGRVVELDDTEFQRRRPR